MLSASPQGPPGSVSLGSASSRRVHSSALCDKERRPAARACECVCVCACVEGEWVETRRLPPVLRLPYRVCAAACAATSEWCRSVSGAAPSLLDVAGSASAGASDALRLRALRTTVGRRRKFSS